MSAICWILRNRWPEGALSLLVVANAVDVAVLHQWEIVPFQLVWAGLAILYGIRLWTVRRTAAALVGVIVVTGLPLLYSVLRGLEPVTELYEIPLISGIFVAMIWHARRYQSAIATQQRLADSQRTFIREAAHELRTPITVARGHAELILTSADRTAAGDADIVLDELGRLSRISERLLLIAASGHPYFLRLRSVDLASFMAKVVDEWRATSTRDWRDDLTVHGTVALDPDRMAAALDAVIENAVSFTNRGDRIAITARGRDGRAVIAVSDSGPGIPAEIRSRVFEPFARGDGPRNRGTGGSGLGLAMVKAIVDAHKGTVSLRSGPAGTIVEITIPGLQADSPPTDSRAERRLPRGVDSNGDGEPGRPWQFAADPEMGDMVAARVCGPTARATEEAWAARVIHHNSRLGRMRPAGPEG